MSCFSGSWVWSSLVKAEEYWRFRMSALSLTSLKSRPLSFKGVIPVLSFLSDLIYVQNLFCLFGWLASESSISIMLFIYSQYDCLSTYWACLFYSLYFLWSLSLLVLLILVYRRVFLRSIDLTFLLIQGFLVLSPLRSLEGMCFSISLRRLD